MTFPSIDWKGFGHTERWSGWFLDMLDAEVREVQRRALLTRLGIDPRARGGVSGPGYIRIDVRPPAPPDPPEST